MMPGSPGDRLFALKTWFGSHLVAQVIGSNSQPLVNTRRGGRTHRPAPPAPPGRRAAPLVLLTSEETFASKIATLKSIFPAREPLEKRHQVSVDHYTGGHMVRTTRNSALPLIMRA